MNKLRKHIMNYFLLSAFGLAVLESIVDSLFDDYLFLLVSDNSLQMGLLLSAYVIICIFIFILFAMLFSKMLNKKITEETREQVNEKNLLFANITHDLKTPITSILGFSRAIKDKQIPEQEMDEIINIIYEKAKTTDELINKLFCYTKLETNEYQMNLERHDMCALLRRQTAEVYQEFERRKMELEIEIPEEAITCIIDCMEMGRAIHNLIINAYKHNPDGTKVYVSVKDKQKNVQVTIADTGKSIKKELQERIFQPFCCGSESRSSNAGSGLGLAIAKKIVEKHGGNLYIEEGLAEYTKTFVMELPK